MSAGSTIKYAVAMALILSSSLAVALDGKTYPGNTCIATGDFAEEAEGYVNGLFNRGSHNLFIKCPVVRDNVTNTTGTDNAKIVVQSNGTDILECALWAHDKDGNFVDVHYDNTTNNIPTSLDLDVNSSVANGNYSISCNLPAAGWIYSYKIKEP